MKIAILDGFPNLPNSAEAEFIKRFEIACQNLGYVEAKGVSCSKDIYDYAPDIVLASHESARKLTRFPTVGMLWSPLSFFEDNEYRINSVKTYDGYIVANKQVENFCRDIQFGTHAHKPIGKEYFLPTSYKTDIVALRDVEEPSLCYMGVHWDGGRHRKVFDLLASRDYVTFYGPQKSWERHSHRYGGMIPFDGRSVQTTLASHGIALCFHKREHRIENTPSMRLFESISVGAIPICDEIEFARTELADVALFVDTTRSPERVIEQIDAHVEWIRNNREEATARVLKGKAWFDKYWALETKIENCIIPTLKEVLKAGHFPEGREAVPADAPIAQPLCEVVVRAGGRPIETLQRAIDSIIAANTRDMPLGIIVVDYKSRDDIQTYIEQSVAKQISARYVRCEDTGARSTAMWAGLKAVRARYTAHLDDDDTIYPNHFAQLLGIMEADQSAPLAYSGCIRKEDSEGIYFEAPNFKGPLNRVIEEDRELCFFNAYDLPRLTHFDNYITSNSWVARTELLQADIGEDPMLEVAEDIFLLFLMAQHGQFQFSYSPTSVWHWQSASALNSMTAIKRKVWKRESRRVLRRLDNLSFAYMPSLSLAKLLKPVSESHIDIASNVDHTQELATTPYSYVIDEHDFEEYCHLEGFHNSETTGVWSKATEAYVTVRLDGDVQKAGGFVCVAFMTSCTGERERFAHLSIEGGERKSFDTSDWTTRTVALALPMNVGNTIKIKVEIDNLYSKKMSATLVRSLGVHIKSVGLFQTLEAANEAFEDAPHATKLDSASGFITEYYEDGDYRQVEIKPSEESACKSYLKLQKNGNAYSLETDIQNLLKGEVIPNDFIESERIPVFRIYFNGDAADIKNRYGMLPERLKEVLKLSLATANGLLLSDIPTQYRSHAAELLDYTRKAVKGLK